MSQNRGKFGVVAAFSGDNDEARKEGILHLQQQDESKEQTRPRVLQNKGVGNLQHGTDVHYNDAR